MKLNAFSSNAILLGAALCAAACAKKSPPPSDAATVQSAPADSPPPLVPATETSNEYYVEGVAGGVMVRTIELQAEVVAVHPERREAVLRGPEGNEVTVKVGKDAVNFYQVEPGDRVNVAMSRELIVYVPEDEEKVADGTEVAEARAAKGETPAGVIVSSTKITSKISAMDPDARTATLVFDDGSTEVFDVRPDIDMSKYHVGEEVVFLMTDLLAMEVEKL